MNTTTMTLWHWQRNDGEWSHGMTQVGAEMMALAYGGPVLEREYEFTKLDDEMLLAGAEPDLLSERDVRVYQVAGRAAE